MAANYSKWTIPDNENFEVFDDAYASEILGSIYQNANIYFTPFLIIYGDLVSIVALAVIIGRRLWLRHEGYIYLVALFVCNVLELTMKYGSYAAGASFGVRPLQDTSTFMCKMLFFFNNLYFFPTCITSLLLLNAYLRLILTQQSQQEQSWRQRCSATLARVYCTPFASKIVTGTMLFFTCFLNVWAFWKADIQHHGYCVVEGSLSLIIWHLFTSTLLWIFPVVLLPVLTTIVWYIGRKRRCVQFFRMNDEDEVSDMEFDRMTLGFSVAVFLSEFPMVILYVVSYATEHEYVIIWDLILIFVLVHGISLCVLSSLCLFGLTSFRNEIRSRLPCIRWRRPTVAAPPDSEGQEERGNSDLNLEAI